MGQNGLKKDSLIPPLPDSKSKTFVQYSGDGQQQSSLIDLTRSRERQKNNDIIDVRKRLLSNEKSFVEASEKSWKSSVAAHSKVHSNSANNEEEKVGVKHSKTTNISIKKA